MLDQFPATAQALGPRPLRLEEYFAGRSHAWGMFQDRFGRLRRQFEVHLDGRWNGRELTLVEHFAYDDGETEHRTWRIRPTGPDGYVGEADDVIGSAIGRADRNTFRWRYRMRLKVGRRALPMRFDDVFVLHPDGTLVNRITVRKLGIRLGEAVLVFRRSPLA